jgi:hypothetical protein
MHHHMHMQNTQLSGEEVTRMIQEAEAMKAKDAQNIQVCSVQCMCVLLHALVLYCGVLSSSTAHLCHLRRSIILVCVCMFLGLCQVR